VRDGLVCTTRISSNNDKSPERFFSSGNTLCGSARIVVWRSSASMRNGSETAASLLVLSASGSRPQERLYAAHLPLNAEWQCPGCLVRSSEIAWNAADKLDAAWVVHHALDVIEKELSARIEVAAAHETRPCSLATNFFCLSPITTRPGRGGHIQ
jgi:hypothetical protein